MGPKLVKPLQLPFPSWYDVNATCEYHMGAVGHTIDNCDAFRKHVLALLDANLIGIKASDDTNIMPQPSPDHGKGS